MHPKGDGMATLKSPQMNGVLFDTVILDDPEDDLLPPARPIGDEEATPSFDGRLLTAGDLTRE